MRQVRGQRWLWGVRVFTFRSCMQKIRMLLSARVPAQFRVEMYNAFNAVVYNARQTQLQLVSPSTQTIRNSQFLADGSVDPTRFKTTSAGFGAVTGAQPLRTIQAQLRFRSEVAWCVASASRACE